MYRCFYIHIIYLYHIQHNLGTIKMHDRKIKPTLFTYRDFFIEILMERFGDDQKKKWDQQKKAAYEDIVWAVLNTKEFLFNH